MRLAAERGVAPEAVAEAFHAFETGSSSVQPLTAAAVSNQSIQESMRLLLMVRAYQVWLGVWQECFHTPQLQPARGLARSARKQQWPRARAVPELV